MPKATPLSQNSHFAILCCTSSLVSFTDKQLIYNSKPISKKQEKLLCFQHFFLFFRQYQCACVCAAGMTTRFCVPVAARGNNAAKSAEVGIAKRRENI
jgi:hypothetical protein